MPWLIIVLYSLLLMVVQYVSVLCALVLEPELTKLLDKQGANLFDIVNPDVISQNVSGNCSEISYCIL